MYNVKDIFLDIIKYDTTSDELSKSYPSTETQLQFGKMLADKLKTFGASNIEIDKYGYVTAEIPSNTEKECPTVGFIAHMDTSPECSGKNINPIIYIVSCRAGIDRIIKDTPATEKIINNVSLSPAVTMAGKAWINFF